MTITKIQAASIFAAIAEFNEPNAIVEVLGEEKASVVCEKIEEIINNTTPNEQKASIQQLLSLCCDYLLEDDGLPTRLEGSD